MNRTFALLIVVAILCLLIARSAIAQVFAQSAPAAAQPAAGQPAPPAVAPAPASPAFVPATPRPPQAGGFIRAGGPGGGAIFYQPGSGFGGDMGFGLGGGHDDPEMSKLVQAEHELAQQSDELVRQYGATDEYAQREKLRGQLRELLVKQFDAQQQRRERELERVEKRISDLRGQLKKRTSARDTIVDRRLENLTSDADGLGWSPPAAGGGAAGTSAPRGINPARGAR